MAYAAVVRWSATRANGKATIVVSVSETEAGTASEWSTRNGGSSTVYGPDGRLADVPIPASYEIGPVQANLVSGTGPTLQPRFGKKPAFGAGTENEIGLQLTAAAAINEGTPLQASDPSARPALYGRSGALGGTDNVIRTTFTVKER